jgi:hypothetical protein
MSIKTSNGNSGGHRWYELKEPHLIIESGEAVLHKHCVQCGRDIVTVLSSGTRHAVYISVFYFYRLDNEVTERWLSEHCPGKRLTSDDEDRKRVMHRIPGAASRKTPPL